MTVTTNRVRNNLGKGKEDGFVRNYTIPNDVEEVTAVIDLTYHVGMEVGKVKRFRGIV